MSAPPPTLLKADRIRKSFGPVEVLHGVCFDLRPGEVHVIAGENGAGKSSLMKIVAGIHTDFEGDLHLHGNPVRWKGPSDAARNGVVMIHQELSLIPTLDITDNLFLGREPSGPLGWIHHDDEIQRAREGMARLGLNLPPGMPVGDAPISTQQLIEITKALLFEARVIIMDEPTSSLDRPSVERLFQIMQELKAEGRGILYITHRMDEIFRLADRITILRDGNLAGTFNRTELTPESLVSRMVGGEGNTPSSAAPAGQPRNEPVLEVREFLPPRPSLPHRAPLSFCLHRGEILGLAGLEGSGNHDLLLALFGAHGHIPGDVRLNGRPVCLKSPASSIAHGMVLLTDDRKTTGLVTGMSIAENITLSVLPTFSPFGWIRKSRERSAAHRARLEMDLRCSGSDQLVEELSGGNQQKTAVAKCLETKPSVLLLDEPTRGIDIAAKQTLYRLMRRWADEGISILLITSELKELLYLSDRILVMHRGNLTANLARKEATEERIISAAMGQPEGVGA